MDRHLSVYPDALGSDEDSNGTFWDIDGYVGPALDFMTPATPEAQEWKSHRLKLATYYYLLRSAVVLGIDVEAEAFKSLCATSLEGAKSLLAANLDLPNAWWITDFRERIKGAGVASPERLEKISVQTVIRPQIYAYSFPGSRRIEVSAIVREHLRTVNLILLTISRGLLDPATRADTLATGENVIELLLPYVFSLYFPNVDHSSLPVPRTPSREVFLQACEVSQIQSHFLLAHEYAHMLHHEGRRPSIELELEADNFAYDLLLDSSEFFKGRHRHQAYMSVRWLFLYLSLDRIVGAVLSDYEPDWIDTPIRDRDALLVPRTSTVTAAAEEHNLRLAGDSLLFHAKHDLRERGVDWIKEQARIFQKKNCI